MPHQLTVRYDDDVEAAITREAESNGVSKNRAALHLLRRGAGLEPGKPKAGKIGNSLDEFFGTWTEEEYQEFKEATKIFDEIDEELWR